MNTDTRNHLYLRHQESVPRAHAQTVLDNGTSLMTTFDVMNKLLPGIVTMIAMNVNTSGHYIRNGRKNEKRNDKQTATKNGTHSNRQNYQENHSHKRSHKYVGKTRDSVPTRRRKSNKTTTHMVETPVKTRYIIVQPRKQALCCTAIKP